jgi:hypothetical protein
MSYSGGSVFGGESEYTGGGETFGGAFSSLSKISQDGKLVVNSVLSVAISVVTLLILLVLLLPIFLPDQWKLIKSNEYLGKWASWSEKQEVKFMYLVLGAYFLWMEWNFKP